MENIKIQKHVTCAIHQPAVEAAQWLPHWVGEDGQHVHVVRPGGELRGKLGPVVMCMDTRTHVRRMIVDNICVYT